MTRLVMHRARLVVATLVATAVFLPVGCNSDDVPGPGPISGNERGIVTGTIVSVATGMPIAGATIRSGSDSGTSSPDGRFSLSVPAAARVVVSIRAVGFAPSLRVARVSPSESIQLTIQLQAVGVSRLLSIPTGGTVAIPNSPGGVVLPANGLASDNGTSASDVTVQLTAINPATDASLMPGDYTTMVAGESRAIESFGALLVDITDAAGKSYDLKPNATATVRIPLGTRSNDPPSTIPLFYLDENTGRWVQEGTATLRGSGSDRYYEGTVTHFTAWNADKYAETILVSGCVRDAAGRPVANVEVQSDGIDYSGSATVYTLLDGSFAVPMRRNGVARISASAVGLSSNSVVAGPSAVNFSLPACLVLDGTIQVSGCVRDAANRPVANAIVHARGLDYPGSAFAQTRSDGTFTLAIRRNGTAEITAGAGLSITNTVIAGPSPVDFTLPTCLVLVDAAACSWEVMVGGNRPERRVGSGARWYLDDDGGWVVLAADASLFWPVEFLLTVPSASPSVGTTTGTSGILFWSASTALPTYWSVPTTDPSAPLFGTALSVSISSTQGPLVLGSATGLFHRMATPTDSNPIGLTGELLPATITFCAVRLLTDLGTEQRHLRSWQKGPASTPRH